MHEPWLIKYLLVVHSSSDLRMPCVFSNFEFIQISTFCLIPLFHRDFDSSFTRWKQGLILLVTYGRLLCHSLMNLICVCWLSGQCLTCLAWSDEVKTVKKSDEGTNTSVPRSFLLILHSSEARFISSDHPRKTIVPPLDESDLCFLTIRSVSGVSGVMAVRWTADYNQMNVGWLSSSDTQQTFVRRLLDTSHSCTTRTWDTSDPDSTFIQHWLDLRSKIASDGEQSSALSSFIAHFHLIRSHLTCQTLTW